MKKIVFKYLEAHYEEYTSHTFNKYQLYYDKLLKKVISINAIIRDLMLVFTNKSIIWRDSFYEWVLRNEDPRLIPLYLFLFDCKVVEKNERILEFIFLDRYNKIVSINYVIAEYITLDLSPAEVTAIFDDYKAKAIEFAMEKC